MSTVEAAPETPLAGAHSATASVALDIGASSGALVIYPSKRYAGREIEISPAGGGRRVHTGVHERGHLQGSTLTAIFGSLPPGLYVIWADADTAATEVTVPAGAVVEVGLS
jgi:hypothetical protein